MIIKYPCYSYFKVAVTIKQRGIWLGRIDRMCGLINKFYKLIKHSARARKCERYATVLCSNKILSSAAFTQLDQVTWRRWNYNLRFGYPAVQASSCVYELSVLARDRVDSPPYYYSLETFWSLLNPLPSDARLIEMDIKRDAAWIIRRVSPVIVCSDLWFCCWL